jgi:hypothetical protein
MEKKSSVKKRKSTKGVDGAAAVEEPAKTKKGPYRNIEESKKH